MSRASAETGWTIDLLIAHLNGLAVGDLDVLKARLTEGRDAARGLGHDEVASLLDEGLLALGSGDLRTYRKRVATAISRLGHLR